MASNRSQSRHEVISLHESAPMTKSVVEVSVKSALKWASVSTVLPRARPCAEPLEPERNAARQFQIAAKPSLLLPGAPDELDQTCRHKKLSVFSGPFGTIHRNREVLCSKN